MSELENELGHDTRRFAACAAARLLADFDDEDDCAEADARAEAAARAEADAARAEAERAEAVVSLAADLGEDLYSHGVTPHAPTAGASDDDAEHPVGLVDVGSRCECRVVGAGGAVAWRAGVVAGFSAGDGLFRVEFDDGGGVDGKLPSASAGIAARSIRLVGEAVASDEWAEATNAVATTSFLSTTAFFGVGPRSGSRSRPLSVATGHLLATPEKENETDEDDDDDDSEKAFEVDDDNLACRGGGASAAFAPANADALPPATLAPQAAASPLPLFSAALPPARGAAAARAGARLSLVDAAAHNAPAVPHARRRRSSVALDPIARAGRPPLQPDLENCRAAPVVKSSGGAPRAPLQAVPSNVARNNIAPTKPLAPRRPPRPSGANMSNRCGEIVSTYRGCAGRKLRPAAVAGAQVPC